MDNINLAKTIAITVTRFYLYVHGAFTAFLTLGAIGGVGLDGLSVHIVYYTLAAPIILFTLASLVKKYMWAYFIAVILFTTFAAFFTFAAKNLGVLGISLIIIEFIPALLLIRAKFFPFKSNA